MSVSHPNIGPGLGNILDSAVKTAFIHLAGSPDSIGKSPVDYLYDDEDPPLHYDYYYEEELRKKQSNPASTWSKHFPVKRRKDFPGHRPFQVAPSKVSKVSPIPSPLLYFIPYIIILPLIGAASYYLVVQNGPTPVVKERFATGRHFDGPEKLELFISTIAKLQSYFKEGLGPKLVNVSKEAFSEKVIKRPSENFESR